MTWQELMPLLPLLILAASAVVVLLSLCIGRNHVVTFVLTVAGLGAALAQAWRQLVEYRPTLPSPGGPLLAMDGAGLYFTALLIAGTLAVAVMAYGYWRRIDQQREEFYLLLILACLGGAVLACAAHFAAFFLGLELLSVPLYALIAYRRGQSGSVEAGLKYLVLAGASSAALLLGMALLYYRAGTLGLYEPAMQALLGRPDDILAGAGVALVLAGAGFKLAAVPFHLWTPDVFEASPAPVTAFVATVSKAAVLAAVLRFFQPALAGCGTAAPGCASVLQASMAGIAIASMFGGNLLALRQRNLKRLLAYSSIAHMGYMLVAFVGSSGAARAIAFYLPAYFVTTLAAFAVIAGLSGPGELEMPSDYRGLARRRPLAAAALTAAMLSLAGIPLTAGFLGKFWVMYGGLQSGRTLLVAALVVNSGIGLYYYLRVVIALYADTAMTTETAKTTATASPRSAGGFNGNDKANDIPLQCEGLGRQQNTADREESVAAVAPGAAAPAAATIPALTGLALIVLVALVLALGVYPGPLLQIIQQTFDP